MIQLQNDLKDTQALLYSVTSLNLNFLFGKKKWANFEEKSI